MGCLSLSHNCLNRLTAQPDPDEAREDREATGGAEGREPKADGHGSAADRPPCQTQETTRHSHPHSELIIVHPKRAEDNNHDGIYVPE